MKFWLENANIREKCQVLAALFAVLPNYDYLCTQSVRNCSRSFERNSTFHLINIYIDMNENGNKQGQLQIEHAKRLLGALQENIMRYEHEFGPIKIPNKEQRTIAPFGVGKGEA